MYLSLISSGSDDGYRWFAKRFLHPDIVAAYKYIFLWDEDIGVDNFDPIRYINIPSCIVSILEMVFG